MLHADHPLPVRCRCLLLDVSRSTAYYQPKPVSDDDLRLMRLIDAMHRARPCYGRRRMRDDLEDRSYMVNCKRMRRLMRHMGLRALYPKPRTSPLGQGHKLYPYRLKSRTIARPNQTWASDICYIPMTKGFM